MILGFDAKRAYRNRTGLGNYSRVLLQALAHLVSKAENEAHQLHLYGPKPDSELLRSFQHADFQHHHPEKWLHQLFPAFWRSSVLTKQLQSDGIQLYHGLSAELPWGISKSGIKSVVTVHDLIFLRYPENYTWFDRRMYTYKLERAVDEADHIVATSHFTAQDLVELLRVNPQKISVHYQDCQPAFKHISSQQSDNTSLVHLGLIRPFLLVVGTIEKRKNGLRLAKAFQKALEMEHIDLVFVGKATAFTELIKQVKFSANAHARIKILENLPFYLLPELYRNCLFHVYVSEYEGFGIPILEALNAGKTSLTSAVGCFSEVGGEAVHYCDAFQVDSIAQGLHDLYLNESFRFSLEARTFEQAAKFSSDLLAVQTCDLYRRLLSA